MAMELPKNREEWNAYQNLILSSKDGTGTIYKGGYYHLYYQPYTPDSKSLKCEGVTLFILRNKDRCLEDFAPVHVLRNEEIGLIDSLNGKISRPFKDRLKEQIATMTNQIKAHDDHNKRVKETAEKVVQCKLNIDNLISEITDGQSIPCSKMIEESQTKALPEGSTPFAVPDVGAKDVVKKCTHPPMMTELERQNKARGINTAIDESARGKRASEMILHGAGRVQDAQFRVIS